MNNKLIKAACLAVATVFAASFAAGCAPDDGGTGNGGYDNEKRALVLNSGEFDGVFNPFFASSAYDSTIVGQTQISMISADDEGKEVRYGKDEPVVALDYNETMYLQDGVTETDQGAQNGYTVYQMVLKNDILFSDGEPLTAHDVLFNLYVYLDPNYTGSSTLYSTDIVGLQAYQAQDPSANEDSLNAMNTLFNALASLRSQAISAYVQRNTTGSNWTTYVELYNSSRLELFKDFDNENGTNLAADYKEYGEEDILADIEDIRTQFKEDLLTTYNSIDMNSYKDGETGQSDYPFDDNKIWQGFFYEMGIITRQYKEVGGVIIYDKDESGKYIIDWAGIDSGADYTKDEAIDYAYQALATSEQSIATILNGYSTGDTMRTNFAGADREYYYMTIEEEVGATVKNVSGIKILDASEFNGDTEYAPGEYEMLQITINGVDPKAKWNFAFSVAPMHYYTTPELNAAAMADTEYEENFGVEFSSLTFMNYIRSRNKVPVGAGVYQASTMYDATFKWETDANGNQTQASVDSWNTVADGFLSSNNLYLMRNDNFVTTGGNEEVIYNAKIKHLQYKVISTSNVMNSVVSGEVDIADPQATSANNNQVNQNSDRLTSISVKTAGYGYIGINAKFVPNINIRRMLMTVMDPTLVQNYYPGGLSEPVYRPFSTTSWVYSDFDDGTPSWESQGYTHYDPNLNEEEYGMSYYGYDASFTLGRQFLQAAGCKNSGGKWYDEDGKPLEFTFTIAGETTDHPANDTFLNAIEILEKNGISATLVADSRALYKLASGGIAIWAAAWSSSIDPDMYQVYHRDSRATSVLNWGYDYLFTQGNATAEENNIVNTLSDLIDEGRETIVESERALIYREASDYAMDLAVELPLYQRSDMYVYNHNVIDASSLYQKPSPYMSPLAEIWKVSFVTA